jgi:hypothetical protein
MLLGRILELFFVVILLLGIYSLVFFKFFGIKDTVFLFFIKVNFFVYFGLFIFGLFKIESIKITIRVTPLVEVVLKP